MKMLCSLVVLIVALAGCASASGVKFPSAGDRINPPVKVSATLLKPEGNGPFPAMVLFHGCDGVTRHQYSWAQELVRQGFVALVVDSFGPRWVSETCTTGSRSGVTAYDRLEDAYGALQYLVGLPYVDADRIGAIGWSQGAGVVVRLLSAEYGYTNKIAGGRKYAAGIAISPWCPLPGSYYRFIPGKLLILTGEADQWTPSANCKSWAERGAVVHIFPGVHHAFDNPAEPQTPTVVRGARVPMGGVSATVAYNPAAAAEAEQLVRKFLGEKLGAPSTTRRPPHQ